MIDWLIERHIFIMLPIEQFVTSFGRLDIKGFVWNFMLEKKKYGATSRKPTVKKVFLTLHLLHCTNGNYLL